MQRAQYDKYLITKYMYVCICIQNIISQNSKWVVSCDNSYVIKPFTLDGM